MTTPMFASIRKYTGVPKLSEELSRHREEIQTAVQPLAGFFAHYVLRTPDGVVSMTVCEQRAGAEDASRVEAAWLKDKLPAFANRAPEITTGELSLHLTRKAAEPVKVTA